MFTMIELIELAADKFFSSDDEKPYQESKAIMLFKSNSDDAYNYYHLSFLDKINATFQQTYEAISDRHLNISEKMREKAISHIKALEDICKTYQPTRDWMTKYKKQKNLLLKQFHPDTFNTDDRHAYFDCSTQLIPYITSLIGKIDNLAQENFTDIRMDELFNEMDASHAETKTQISQIWRDIAIMKEKVTQLRKTIKHLHQFDEYRRNSTDQVHCFRHRKDHDLFHHSQCNLIRPQRHSFFSKTTRSLLEPSKHSYLEPRIKSMSRN
jgi:hypothetical protein